MEQELISKNYSIHIDSSDALKLFVQDKKYSKVFILVDENTEKFCLHKIIDLLPEDLQCIRIHAGEIHKNILTSQKIWKKLIHHGADRHSLLINLGGGVLCDMGGFCAATYMRGFDFIHLPTTLLSMADASIGGKVGIDFMTFKNIVGLISEPQAVFVFTEFLETLPYEELRSGYAELLKHGLINDHIVWQELITIQDITQLDFSSVIKRSIAIKANITEQDPTEKGIRKILNFGHTIGHAIESYWLDSKKPLLHGEAVAIGMVAEAFISYSIGKLSEQELFEIRKKIIGLYGHQRKYVKPIEKIISFMQMDKKNYKGTLRMSLLNKIGEACYDVEVQPEIVFQSLVFYREKL